MGKIIIISISLLCSYFNGLYGIPDKVINSDYPAYFSTTTAGSYFLLTTQAYNIKFTFTVPSTSIKIDWTKGNGTKRVVFVKQTNSVVEVPSPVNGTSYAGSPVFGTNQLGSTGWYCVFNGTGTSVTVTGLNTSNAYRVAVFEYDGNPGLEQYNTSFTVAPGVPVQGNPVTTAPTVQAGNVVISNLQSSQTDISWTRGNGSRCAVFIKPNTTATATPAPLNNTSYTADPVYGNGSVVGGWYCVYKGVGTNVSVSNLPVNNQYQIMVVELNGTDLCEQYITSSSSNNPVGILQNCNIVLSNVLPASMNIVWTKGGGTGRCVFIKQTSSSSELALPVNNNIYSPNAIFGQGSQIGTSGWYCVYNGTGTSLSVYGFSPGKMYRVMVCEYTGTPGNEIFNKLEAVGNPLSCPLSVQASNIVFSNIKATTLDLSWSRGSEDSCAVFMKQASSGSVTPVNGVIYTANASFPNGDPVGTSGWFCVYKGTGTTETVTVANPNLAYQIMVCEFTNLSGYRFYNPSTSNNLNPVNKPATTAKPTQQSYNIVFSNLLSSSATISWAKGNGSKRAVFIKQTMGSESASPVDNATYLANTSFGNGTQIDLTGWYCVYNNNGASVNVYGLIPGTTYRVMVCEYNGNPGMEQYQTTVALPANPSSVKMLIQASNIVFSNIISGSMDVSWNRGTGDSCIVFVKKGANPGNAYPEDDVDYVANGTFPNGSQIGTSLWYCVYKGKGSGTTITGLDPQNSPYRIMVCEYSHSGTSPKYIVATAQGNPADNPLFVSLGSPAKDIVYKNIASNYLTVSWTNVGSNPRAVFMKETSLLEIPNPSLDTTYTANSTFQTGSQIGNSGWYCIYTGTGASVNVYGLKPGGSYCTMVSEYNGAPGFEQYNTTSDTNNPALIQLLIQANNIVASNVTTNSMDLSWSRGSGDSCAVFVKQASSGNAVPVNGFFYKDNTNFTSGSPIGTSGWYCVYTGKGSATSVSGLAANSAYQIMVCEFTCSGGVNFYNTSLAPTNNPVNKTTLSIPPMPPSPFRPTSQATNILFGALTSTSMVVNWTIGNGTNRAVFVKKTSGIDFASPVSNTTYNASLAFGSGDEIGSSGWYCVYNGNLKTATVTGLVAGDVYRVMVCEYGGSAGSEIYNTDWASGNPASILFNIQASALTFKNVQSNTMDVSWTRGGGDACVVFIRPTTSGNATLINNLTYKADSNYGHGSPDGSGWFCVYNGIESNVGITGLIANTDYRVMVCEYSGSSGNEIYNSSTSTGNLANKPNVPGQASNILFSNIASASLTVAWSNGVGSKRAVFIKKTKVLESALPVTNELYNANTAYGLGSQIGSSGWYCISNGTTSPVTVTGLTPGETYRVMACEYNGNPDEELYNKDNYINNPASILLTTQASNIIFSKVQNESTKISWTKGTGDGRVVFMKQATNGSVSVVNSTTYQASKTFGLGSPDGTGWFCIYNGTGDTVTVSGLIANKEYRVMVCEYSGSVGSEQYNSSTLTTNPVQKTFKPATQANNINFSAITNNSMSLSWSTGNGIKRAVFVKETTAAEIANPISGKTYVANTAFGSGDQIGTKGWFCVYNNSTPNSVAITNLKQGTTYRVMVCEYNGNPGDEQYNTDMAVNNGASATLTLQATNVLFTNILPTSMDVSWTKGSDNNCVVFVAPVTSGNVSLLNGNTYNANPIFGIGSPNGSGWFCVYKGTSTNVTITGLTPGQNYRVMVCGYSGAAGSEIYNTSVGTTLNPGQKTLPPTAQASSVTMSNILVDKATISWTKGNGVGSAVFMKQTSSTSETVVPVNNTNYYGNGVFGVTQVGTTGWYCIYKGTNTVTSTDVTGLTGGATYRVMVCEYNGITNGEQFNNTSITSNIESLTTFATAKAQTITFNALAPRQFGTVDFDPGATSTSKLSIKYASSNLLVATIVSEKVHIVGMGNTIITASQPGDANFNAATPVSQPLRIDKGTQGIDFAPLPLKFYGDADFYPGAIGTSGLPVTYSSNNQSVAVVINNKIHIVGVGISSISAFQEGNDNFYPANSVFQTLIVGKANQTITFNALPAMTFKDFDLDPEAYSSSGLLVTYTSSNTSVATIVGGRIHLVGTGSVNIIASQDGNAVYNEASKVYRTLNIQKAEQTISFASMPELPYEDVYYNPASSTSGLDIEYISDNTTVAEIVNGRIHVVGAGVANITATQPGNDNYNAAAAVVKTLTVQRNNQTITFGVLPSAVFGDPDYVLNAIASSGLPVQYTSDNTSVATIMNGKIHIVGSGNANITASQPGSDSYYPATLDVIQPFSVSPATQTISFNSIPTKVYGDPDFNLTASASSGMLVYFSSDNPLVATVTGDNVHIVGAGIVNITATQPGGGSYGRAPYVVHKLVVNMKDQIITFGTLPSKTFGDPDFGLYASSGSGLPVSFMSDNTSVATVVNGVVHIVGAGSANIIASQSGNNNYNTASPVSQILTVAKASQVLTFFSISDKVYSDADFNPGAYSNIGLPVSYSSNNTDVAIVVGDKIHIVGIGTVTITASQNGNVNYNAVVSIPRTFTVNKASQSITFNIIPSKPYGSANFSVLATSSSGLELTYQSSDPTVATVTYGIVHIVGVGSTLITANQVGDNNFYPTSKIQTFTVTTASQTISFDEIPDQIYGNDDIYLEATASSGLPVTYTSSNPGIANVTYGWLQIFGTGPVTITALQTGNDYYSAAANVSHTFVINKHTQDIYFDDIPEPTYGDADFNPGAVVNSGLPVLYSSDNEAVASIKNGKIHIVGAGTTNITALQLGNSNFSASASVSKVLVVKKATLEILANNASRKYNTENPLFTCLPSGFVNGDDASDIDVNPWVTTSAIITSNPGTYDLVPHGGLDNNYNFSYKNGTLTILGTFPLKASKPFGKEVLCINPENQAYTTTGAIFSTSFVWSLLPSNAGTISGSGNTAEVNFNDSYTGPVSISVKGKNMIDIGENSDTLHIHVLPKIADAEISSRGSYCNNNPFGDSILIVNSPAFYYFKLSENGSPINSEIQGNGSNIGWYDLKFGTYAVSETVCDVVINENIVIREVTPTSSIPQLHLKWNDVLVCPRNEDSIISYKWYKDGELIPGENKQYLWTQQKTGNYSVKTTDDSGCEFSSESKFVERTINGLVYPNPNSGQFKVSFTCQEKGQVVLKVTGMNSLFVKSFSYQKDNDDFEQEISVPGLAVGSYLVDVLVNGKRIFYEKFIVD